MKPKNFLSFKRLKTLFFLTLIMGGFAFVFKSFVILMMVLNLFSFIPNQSNIGLNILVVGTDNVDGTQRSDAISVIHVNNNLTDIRALSIPRDTRVNIEGYGPSKLNHAYAYGGISLLKRTISEFLSIPIDHYVIINAAGLKQIVDEVGGINIHIDSPMVYDDYAGNLHINFAQGNHQLNGEDLVKFIRFRNDSQGDIGRIRRQQQVIEQLYDQLFKFESIALSPKLLKLFLSSFKTDISFLKASRWVNTFFKVKDNANVSFFTVPGSVRIIDGVSYWRPNIVYLDSLITKTFVDFKGENSIPKTNIISDKKFVSKNQIKRVKQHLVLDQQQSIRSEDPVLVEVLNGNGQAGIASSTARFLKEKNMVITRVDNSESFDYKNTIIVDWKGDLEKSLRLAKLLNIDPSNIVVYDRKEKPLDITLVLGKNWTDDIISKLASYDIRN
ncbi:MAG: LCP family protein [Candidatus Margulisiibacteriota bacterium]|nr:LCP family protein [Candidatus Margulisiibacteriota bacterium]